MLLSQITRRHYRGQRTTWDKVTALTDKVTVLNVKVTALNVKVTALTDKVTALNVKVTALNVKVTALNVKVTALIDKATALNVKVTALNVKGTALNVKVTALTDKVTVLNVKVKVTVLNVSNTIRNTSEATIRPMGLGQYDGHGENCDLSTASEMFLMFTTQLYTCLCNYNAILTRGKYCNRNTPNPQNSPLLTSGG